jgi:hypothetical protein
MRKACHISIDSETEFEIGLGNGWKGRKKGII